MANSVRYNVSNTPYSTKFTESGRVYAFPSLKQMSCFGRIVKGIVEVYGNGTTLYVDNKPIATIDEAIECAYKGRYGEWANTSIKTKKE